MSNHCNNEEDEFMTQTKVYVVQNVKKKPKRKRKMKPRESVSDLHIIMLYYKLYYMYSLYCLSQ